MVPAQKGTKDVLSYTVGSERELITVLVCGGDVGFMLRTLILFDGKVQIVSRFDGTDDGCFIGVNDSGVMDNEIFKRYVDLEHIPNMTAVKVSRL